LASLFLPYTLSLSAKNRGRFAKNTPRLALLLADFLYLFTTYVLKYLFLRLGNIPARKRRAW